MPGEVVLDVACCTGYGSHILSLSQASKVIGLEIDEGCIISANNNWKTDKTEFHVKDLNTCELPECDIAVSLETIEHLDDMHHFIDQLHTKVRRCIVACVPLGGTSWAYKDEPPSPGTEKNDFMTRGVFEKLLVSHDDWKVQSCFEYGYSVFVIAFRKELERQ